MPAIEVDPGFFSTLEIRPLQGRVFTGEQALSYGLVDELGTLEDATRVAAKLAGIREEPEVVSKKDKISIFDVLRNKFPKELTDVFPTVKIKYLYSP